MNNYNSLIKENGICLKQIGIDNYAFSKKDALNILNVMEKNNLILLGGDVYQNLDGKIKLTFENWYLEQHINENLDQFKSRSIQYAKKYINNFVNSEVLFSFTIRH